MNTTQQPIVDYFLNYPPRSYNKGSKILDSSLQRDTIFYLEKGYVKLFALSAKGNEKCYMFYKAGELFPLERRFHNKQNNIFFEAMCHVTVRVAPMPHFKTFVAHNPQAVFAYIDTLLDVINVFVDRVDNLELTTAQERLIDSLLSLAGRFGKLEENKISIVIPLTHRTIATTINMSRETVSRELELLQKIKLITLSGHTIVINDLQRLKNKLENRE